MYGREGIARISANEMLFCVKEKGEQSTRNGEQYNRPIDV
jgi:hypothetical protein